MVPEAVRVATVRTGLLGPGSLQRQQLAVLRQLVGQVSPMSQQIRGRVGQEQATAAERSRC